MNYLDKIGQRIYRRVESDGEMTEKDVLLYRLYALLALAKGEQTTAEDVHNAWAAWAAVDRPWHAALVPFSVLPEDIQALDEPYVEAIRRVAVNIGD